MPGRRPEIPAFARMSDQPHDILASTSVQRDLQATIAARAELGPEMEEHVIEAFLSRIDAQIQARVDGAVAQKRAGAKKSLNPTETVLPSFALAIPLVAIAGGITGALGIVAVMICVFLVNLLYVAYDLWG